ncbi:MAG: helix-turn-helix domain-containing protein [Rikenellaceae bacterium]
MENEKMEIDHIQIYDFIEKVTDQMMQRFDDIEQVLRTIAPKSMRTAVYLDGERLFDNQDLCEMFGKSKRSLQRYRSEGSLPYVMIKNSAHYKESHFESFKRVITEEFAQQEEEEDYAT